MKLSAITENQRIQKLFLSFMMYAFLGWFYEVFLEVVVYRWGYSDRGVLLGPYCPVYGVGAILFLGAFRPLMKKKEPEWFGFCVKPIIIFLGCMAIATTVELLASYMLEFFTGAWPWQTYADYKINFQARIALSPSIRFGLGGLLFLYIVQPFYDWLFSKAKKKTLNIITAFVALIVLCDCIYTFIIK